MIQTAIRAAASPTFASSAVHCRGEICLWCQEPIRGVGYRLACFSLTTHAHLALRARRSRDP